ncbi:class I adenylate-forming enzyme family protein [Aquabacter cavernae]|uniref:class I adenylate-forming enzyme family protein n=1 Tax=Aquabacter cavernae TaxID=2496029 RepID=UPI0013E058CE|nr:AMP-binding protein [Aquabacter cavernae]
MRLPDFLDKSAGATPSAPAIWYEGQTYDYDWLRAASLRCAQALCGVGFPAGACIASWLPNHPMGFVVQFGVHRLPLRAMPLNPRATAGECIDIMKMFAPEWLFIHASFADALADIRAAVPSLRGVVVVDGTGAGDPSMDAFLATARDVPVDSNIGGEDVVTLLTTGGSTGLPKGVMRASRNWSTLITNYRLAMPVDGPPVNLAVTPLTHVAGDVALAVFAQGGLNVILPKPRPRDILKAMGDHGVTHMFVPPTLLYMMLAEPDVASFDFGALRYLMYGAAPISVDKLREAWSVFGPVMTQLYGLMEATSTVSIMTPSEHAEAFSSDGGRFGSIGRGSAMTLVDVVDEAGLPVGLGETGEVVCHGPNLFKGYVDNAEATAKALRNGWFRTGDLGVKDAGGYVRLVDRSKDIIITGGINVFPGEIEQVIWRHPAVQDCAVIGVPDDKWGEAVTAVLELKPGESIREDEVIAMCKKTLGSIKTPKTVVVWPELPRSTVGKVLKKDIRAHYWKGRSI